MDLEFRKLDFPTNNISLEAFLIEVGITAQIISKKPQNRRGKIQWVCVEFEKLPIGIARLEIAQPHFAYVSHLIIISAYRRQGVGSWFMNEIEKYCGTLSVHRMLLQPGSGTDAYHQALGFLPDPKVPPLLMKVI